MHVSVLATRPQRIFAVVMDAGEEVTAGLAAFARHGRVEAASFTAIGAISEGTLGFFDPDIREYRKIPVTEQAEIVSLVGDITRSGEDDPDGRTAHGHMVVAFADGRTLGGHLIRATVRPTLELIVTESPGHLQRRHDRATGLALIDLAQSETEGETFSLAAEFV